MKSVANVMNPTVLVIDSHSTVAEAAKKMKEFDVGALAVMSAGAIVALLTDRDIVIRAVAESRNLSLTKIAEIMSGTPIACKMNDSLEKAAELLSIYKIHRLLVTDDSNQVVGILSLVDLAIQMAAEDSQIIHGVLEDVTEDGRQGWLDRSQEVLDAVQRIPIL
ncbi:MAG: CBS domain-containing protein [Desulfomonilaceae bacterium]